MPRNTNKEISTAKGDAKKRSKKSAAPRRVTDPYTRDHFYLFHEGSDCRAYDFLGAHPTEKDGCAGYRFRVWAPNAQSVSVIGEFNGWDRKAGEMELLGDGETWEKFIEGAKVYDAYKFSIEGADGEIRDKCDPYAFHSETRPANASKLFDIEGYQWKDEKWMRNRVAPYAKPLSIYEIHLGSWKKVVDGADGQFFSYDMIADELVPYIVQTGYTHVELMPVSEHPLDASWGYQCTGYFAATSRFGDPHGLMRLIDRLHCAGIGVILDWVPAHFPKDGHGLVEFDGGACYESNDPVMREHPDWGTRIFDYSRGEVRSFLISSANFWLEKFHADGLRIDAVASMLYLDYGRRDGEWHPNKDGGKENLDAVEFFRKLNTVVFAEHPSVMMIAEESTAWPGVTLPVSEGGLGFNFKWNMGWMNDMMHYVALDPYFRQFNHKDITFSFMYAFSENYILPVSHDEVVHGKCSLINKMPGEYEQKFAGVRVFLAYMFAHPGKKLLFMGQEFGQFIEWNFDNGLDWLLLGYESHRKLLDYVSALNRFYRARRELWSIDFDWHGFEWICHDDTSANTVSFIRRDDKGKELICVINFSPVRRTGYLVGVEQSGVYEEIFNTDDERFGGSGITNPGPLHTYKAPQHGKDRSLRLDLPPLGAVFLRIKRKLKGDKPVNW